METEVLYLPEKLINKFIDRNPINKGKEVNPFIILLDGPIGSGKTTLANIISKKMNIVVLSNDKIRQFLYTENIKDTKTNQELTGIIQSFRIKENLLNSNSCLLDRNVSNNYLRKKERMKKYNVPLYIISIIYNREQVIERLNKRVVNKFEIDNLNSSEVINYSEANYENFLYNEMIRDIIPNEDIYFKIDMTKDFKDIEKQVDILINEFKKDNILI